MKKFIVTVLLTCAIVPLASARQYSAIDTSKGCKTNPAITGKCFALSGRVSITNGTPSMRIWPIGTHRLLGVLPSEEEIVPLELKHDLGWGSEVYANLIVCPFTPQRPGEMQMVCVESMKNARVERAK